MRQVSSREEEARALGEEDLMGLGSGTVFHGAQIVRHRLEIRELCLSLCLDVEESSRQSMKRAQKGRREAY